MNLERRKHQAGPLWLRYMVINSGRRSIRVSSDSGVVSSPSLQVSITGIAELSRNNWGRIFRIVLWFICAISFSGLPFVLSAVMSVLLVALCTLRFCRVHCGISRRCQLSCFRPSTVGFSLTLSSMGFPVFRCPYSPVSSSVEKAPKICNSQHVGAPRSAIINHKYFAGWFFRVGARYGSCQGC